MSESEFTRLIDLFFAIMIWHFVLARNAYPKTIPTHLKWCHALVLFYVSTKAYDSFFYIFMEFILHPREVILCLSGQPNVIGTPVIGGMAILRGTTGTVLLLVSSKLMKRNGKYLRWFMIFWSIHFLSTCYLDFAKAPTQSLSNPVVLILGTFILVVPPMLCLIFYTLRFSKVIFEGEVERSV